MNLNFFNNNNFCAMRQLLLVLLAGFFLLSWGGVYASPLTDVSRGSLKSRFTHVSTTNLTLDSCVQDHTTGLMWEIKTDDGGLRDWNKRYSNYDNSAAEQFWTGSAWIKPTQEQIDAPSNSVGFKNRVNAQGLCGFHDWRLPTLEELQSILDTSRAHSPSPSPTLTIDANWFPNTQVAAYWSATPGTDNSTSAWYVYFGKGGTFKTIRPYNYFIRLVRDSR